MMAGMTQASDMCLRGPCSVCRSEAELSSNGLCSSCEAKGSDRLMKEYLEPLRKKIQEERLRIAAREIGMSYEDIEKEAILEILDEDEQ
jgi:predicted amidophosphoribosyltransferase